MLFELDYKEKIFGRLINSERTNFEIVENQLQIIYFENFNFVMLIEDPHRAIES